MKLYYAEICDYLGEPVITTEYFASNRRAGAVGKQETDRIPPACSYNVRLMVVNASWVADLINEENKREQ
jgi:hypothetical protein